MIRIHYENMDNFRELYYNRILEYSFSFKIDNQTNSDKKEFIQYIKKHTNENELNLNDLYNLLLENDNDFKTYFKNISFRDLLLKDFSELKNINITLNLDLKNLLKQLFNYTQLQQDYISPFFEKYIKPTTCYYCNIDFINVFFKKYDNIIDFINNADEKELKKIDGIGNKRFKKIIDKKPIKNIHTDLPKEILTILEKVDLNYINPQNGFTLDHVIDKGEHPHLALSLFNLVPSCYICNSKLKGSKEIGGKSPTDQNFDFHEKVKFKTFLISNNLSINNDNDLDLQLRESGNEYAKYIEVFRLNERYAFHKYHVIEMIKKRQKYPDSRIKELAGITGQSIEQVKKDLFGEYLFDEKIYDEKLYYKIFSKRPLSKLTNDIAKELELL